MARKGNQQKNGLERNASNHKKGGPVSGSALPNKKGRGNVSEVKASNGEEPSYGIEPSIPLREGLNRTDHLGDEKKNKKKMGKFVRADKQGTVETQGIDQTGLSGSNSGDRSADMSMPESSSVKEENMTSPNGNVGMNSPKSSLGRSPDGLDADESTESEELSGTKAIRRLRTLALSSLKSSTEWLERHKPLVNTVISKILNARDYVRTKIEHSYPIVLGWLMHFANILLLLLMVWLDCGLRGVDSILRMGTTSFLTVVWCSVLSIVAMIGMLKFIGFVAIAALMGLFLGFTIAVLLIAVSGIVFLWLYGSFWTTALVIFFGGTAFTFRHERLALLIMTVYSMYSTWTFVGWLGLFLCLNLSFISSDALIFFLRNNINEHRRSNGTPEQAAGMQGGPGIFSAERVHASSSETGTGLPADRSPGVPSTSGSDSDVTSEDEVLRLLNSTDHYSALGLSRFEEVDVSILKREYRKKAMLVHPDKNMGNEKAAEAFKKLQNAYEILLDSSKRKVYDDELRREDLLTYFRRFQNSSQRSKGHGFFSSTFGRTEPNVEDPLGESRRIACRKCDNFHMWFYTKKSKSRARWCQDCKDFHPAKDGDGWVEQSSQPLLFGILQKVDAPCAYVCADSKIYDATEWYICQGMKCPVNTHKPSFHVNTSVTAKHSSGKGTSSGQRGGMPSTNMEETMTEEEFFEWLQNAVQAGMFDNFAGTTSDSPSSWPGNSSKSSGTSNAGSGSSNSGSKRKKKGKKPW